MHSAIGMWIVPFFLLMCFTGLYWSYDWYRSAMFTIMQVEQPKELQLTTQVVQIGQQKEKQSEKEQKSENSQN